MTTAEINTYDLAKEKVAQHGDTYNLPSTTPLETSGSVPALVYDADEKTIWSRGGKKYDVTTREALLPAGPEYVKVDHHGRYPWMFGSGADATERAKIQHKRANALIMHAEFE